MRSTSAPSAMHWERSDSAQEFDQTIYLAEDLSMADDSGSPRIQALRIRDTEPMLSASPVSYQVNFHSAALTLLDNTLAVQWACSGTHP